MSTDQEMRGDLREELSQTLLKIGALQRLDADKDLIEIAMRHANKCRELLSVLSEKE
jgi:hypothetical protein